MKKTLQTTLFIVAILFSGVIKSYAQWDIDIMGPRLAVDPPTAINHILKFTFSADGTTPWGGNINTPVIHQELVKAGDDSTACSPLTKTVTGKWVLIYRGNCEFGAKALAAQQKGATGVIIWDHSVEGLVTMGAGAVGGQVTIPVLFISHSDGLELTNQLNNGQVFISLTRWGFGKSHDMSIVPSSSVLPHALAIPAYQFDGTDVPAYRGYTGAFAANLGTGTETNVMLKSNITWTPKGGSASAFYSDSVKVGVPAGSGTIKPSDSIDLNAFSSKEFKFTPSGEGQFDFTYTLTADSADMLPADNTEKFTMSVTSNTFAKGRFDVATQKPVITSFYGSYQNGVQQFATEGPLFFVHKGGHALQAVSFAVKHSDTNNKVLAGTGNDFIDFYMYKWNDDNSDKQMQAKELKLVSIAIKKFIASDSNNGKIIFSANWGDAVKGAPALVNLEDDSWYWVAANLSNVFLIGGDDKPNFYNRTNAAKNFATNKRDEFWAPRYKNDASNISSNPDDIINLIPFGASDANNNNIDSTVYTSADGVINLAVHTDTWPTKIDPTVTGKDKVDVYPNPASDKINVAVQLSSKSGTVYFKIIDGLGKTVTQQQQKDIQKGTASFSTQGLAAGNYYMIVITDDNAVARPFTVSGK